MNDMAQNLARLALEIAEPAHEWPAAPEPEPEPKVEPESAVLRNLCAGGLATHAARGAVSEAGDGTGGETGALRALCGLVAGPIYRLDRFHYAFRLRPDDLGGQLEDLAPAQWVEALEAALHRAGVALEVQSLAPPPMPEAERAADEDFAAEAPVWLLRAWDAAVAAGVQAAGPGVQAVINAHFAAATARLTAALVAAERPAHPPEAASAGPDEAPRSGPAPEMTETAPGAPQTAEEAAPQEAGDAHPAPVAQGAPADIPPDTPLEPTHAEAPAPLPPPEAAPEAVQAEAPAEAAPCAAEAERGSEMAALERRLAALEALLRG